MGCIFHSYSECLIFFLPIVPIFTHLTFSFAIRLYPLTTVSAFMFSFSLSFFISFIFITSVFMFYVKAIFSTQEIRFWLQLTFVVFLSTFSNSLLTPIVMLFSFILIISNQILIFFSSLLSINHHFINHSFIVFA